MKREKMTFNVSPAVRTEIKNYVKLLGFKSESDLCNKAINEYLTKLHYEALREYGPSPEHRPSFLRKMH